jgi:uncharacterized protein YfdQ (DUF2303 family)
MSTITFDTLKFAQRLEKAGATREYAQAEAEALSEVFEIGTQELVTKADLLAVKTDLLALKTELKSDMREMKAEIMGEMKLSRWMLAAVIGLAIANFAKQYF